MKVLFAVNNDEISNAIIKKYQKNYKEIISYKNVYYFNAIIKELQKDSTYDRIVISEELEPFANNNYDTIDKFIFEKLDNISDEATNKNGNDSDIILVCSDRRTKTDDFFIKLFGIGVYSAIIGNDRNIEEICRLINSPRTKKDAKLYYKIDADNVKYQIENENNVSEAEVQNILAHYKRLGKNEDKYVESFNNIVSQYNDTQLKIIIRYLPMSVKAVLEAKSPKYQQLVTFNNDNRPRNKVSNGNKVEKQNLNVRMLEEESVKKNIKNPIVIPSKMDLKSTKKVINEEKEQLEDDDYIDIIDENDTIDEPLFTPQQNKETHSEDLIEDIFGTEDEETIEEEKNIDEIDEFDFDEKIVDENDQPKRGRGRPRKKPVDEVEENKPKRGRGRPKKNTGEDINIENIYENHENNDEEDEELDLFSLDESDDIIEETFDESKIEQDDEELEGNNNENDEAIDLFGLDEEDSEVNENNDENDIDLFDLNEEEIEQDDSIEEYNDNSIHYSTNNVISKDRRIVSFVGTTKNGTSFVVNNLAEMLSSMGISTAILDMSKNKNAYYIYTNNTENLRQTAYKCMEKLKNNVAEGIKINKNLSIFTDIPGEEKEYTSSEIDCILNTLANNFSVVLIDCDFSTPSHYFERAQEIYIVQSMDILTIQPLTAFLKQLKNRNILKPEKLRVIVNKEQKMKNLPIKLLISGISKYNSPDMTLMDNLFDKDTIKYCTIPFEMQNYYKYLETLVDCEISLNGYSKNLIEALKYLANMVYPLVGQTSYNPRPVGYNGKFSSEMNSTLNKMKRNYQ